MKRLHVHLNVTDLDEAVAYYAALFGKAPTRSEPGYANWLLDDPGVNFAISADGGAPGLSHLGIQTDSAEELERQSDQLQAAERPLVEEKDARILALEGENADLQEQLEEQEERLDALEKLVDELADDR